MERNSAQPSRFARRRTMMRATGAMAIGAWAPAARSARADAARAGVVSDGDAHGGSDTLRSWPLNTRARTGIHDLAPAPGGGVWYTAQASGHLGHFDPASGKSELIDLGRGSAPHGVIQGPDGAAWITDGGQNAIVRVGWPDRKVRVFPLPSHAARANLNTAAFDGEGRVCFTGQAGCVGRLEPQNGHMQVWRSPRGGGPYGMCATPSGDVWWCSLGSSYIARMDRGSGESVVVDPPTPKQGARRVWSDSAGRIWVAEWNSGQLSMHDPASGAWKSWRPPGEAPKVYAVYVDERDQVWISDFAANAVLRFDPESGQFRSWTIPREDGNVRQILGRPGEVWFPESGTEHISMLRTLP